MIRIPRLLALAPLLVLAGSVSFARAEGEGQADLDEALRVKITAEGLRDLNQVIELLEKSLEKGLDVESSDFAEQMLSESLLQRATELGAVVESVPKANLADSRMQRILALATSDLRRVLDYDNPPAKASAMLARLLALTGGDDDEARELLDAVIEGEGFAELPVGEQAEALALRGSLQTDSAQALADYARAIELAPDQAKYRLSRAEFQFQNDDVEGALTEVRAVVEQTPDQIAAHVLLVEILRTLKRYDEALAAADRIAEIAPTSPMASMTRGEIYREMEEFDKAIAEFSRVLEIEPGLDLALIRRAESYFLAGKLDQALADVDAVIADNPRLVVAHGLRAQVLAGKENFSEAISEMKLLAEELPGQADVRMHLALYYLLNDQPRQAIDAYTEVLDVDPKNFLALRSRGDAYLSVGEHGPAIDDFTRALELAPEDSALLNNLAWVLATSPVDQLRDGKRAIELAAKACELTEYKQAHILSTLAAAYAEAGDFDTARKWSQQAVDMNDPEHAEQLAKELASYVAKQPWRERQTEPGIEEGAAAKAGEETPQGDAPGDDEAGDDEAGGEDEPSEEEPSDAEPGDSDDAPEETEPDNTDPADRPER
ncbi:MAG TPA: tetratricopeptide repeat protein [Lacipirellulaceae bacterium]|nr:tetratricopeptide repeat protein [Lacipirellulaceae bacterium]